jgi:hypothetical protein
MVRHGILVSFMMVLSLGFAACASTGKAKGARLAAAAPAVKVTFDDTIGDIAVDSEWDDPTNSVPFASKVHGSPFKKAMPPQSKATFSKRMVPSQQ